MRIAYNFHTTDKWISGVEHYSLNLLNALLQIDRDNQYIVFTNQPQLVRQRISKAKNLAITDLSILNSRAVRILWEHLWLARAAKERHIDLIHCPHYIAPIMTAGIPVIVTIHDTIAIDSPQYCKGSNALYYNLFFGKTIKNADAVIALSKLTANNLGRKFDIDNRRIHIIYPGVDPAFETVTTTKRKQTVRSKYNLPDRYILFVGNIEPKKNISALLTAYKILKKDHIDHKLVLVGKRSWKSKNIYKKIETDFASNDIILTGYVGQADLPAVYQMSDICVSPSLCEGLNFPAIEAMTSNTPLAATQTGILNQLSIKSYFPLDPHNPAQIAQAVVSLIANTSLRNSQTRRARRISKRFNWTIAAKKTLSLYMETIKNHEHNQK